MPRPCFWGWSYLLPCPAITATIWGNLPNRGVGSQHRDQRGIKSHWTVSLLFSLISHLPLLSLETVLTDSSSCSGLTHVLLERQKEIILLCSVSLIQSLALGFPVVFEESFLSTRIILSKSSTSYGPGGVGWDLSPETTVFSTHFISAISIAFRERNRIQQKSVVEQHPGGHYTSWVVWLRNMES